MIIYHATKSYRSFMEIQQSLALSLGKNVNGEMFAHVSMTPFIPGSFALLTIAHDRAWIFELEIDDDTRLENDPSGEDTNYPNTVWKVCREAIPIKRILSVQYIPEVLTWELEGPQCPKHLRKYRYIWNPQINVAQIGP